MGGAKSPRRVYSKPMKKEMESTFDMRTINIQSTTNIYGKFQDPNKISSVPLILNLWIEKD